MKGSLLHVCGVVRNARTIYFIFYGYVSLKINSYVLFGRKISAVL